MFRHCKSEGKAYDICVCHKVLNVFLLKSLKCVVEEEAL